MLAVSYKTHNKYVKITNMLKYGEHQNRVLAGHAASGQAVAAVQVSNMELAAGIHSYASEMNRRRLTDVNRSKKEFGLASHDRPGEHVHPRRAARQLTNYCHRPSFPTSVRIVIFPSNNPSVTVSGKNQCSVCAREGSSLQHKKNLAV